MPHQPLNKEAATEHHDNKSGRSDEVDNTHVMNPHVRLVLEQALVNGAADEAEAFNTFLAYDRAP